MGWYDEVKAGVAAAVSAAWPEIGPGELFLRSQIERRNWLNLISPGQGGPSNAPPQVSPPWGVVDIQPRSTDDWGTGRPRYLIEITAYYIAMDAAGEDVSLYGKLDALKTAVFASQSLGTVLPEIEANASAENPISGDMLRESFPLSAASLKFTTIAIP